MDCSTTPYCAPGTTAKHTARRSAFLTTDAGQFTGELHVVRVPSEDEDDHHHLVCSIVDLTERLRHESEIHAAYARLRDSETRYRMLADYSADWDYWLGPNQRYLYVSPACEYVCGHAPDDFMADPKLMDRSDPSRRSAALAGTQARNLSGRR
jgi:two-component system, sensor histidine kinase and response regulator